MRSEQSERSRWVYAVAIAAVITAGLFSRSHFTAGLPQIVTKAAGDALWSAMILLGFAFLFPRTRTLKLACATYALSATIEFSQFYHAEWIDRIRGTFLGSQALGFGFHATDLIWYALGTMIGVALDRLLHQDKSASR